MAWIAAAVISAQPVLAAGNCDEKELDKEKNVIRKYLSIKQNTCRLAPAYLLNLSKEAYVSGNYAIGIWAIRSVLATQKKHDINEMAEFYYYLGLSYLGKERNEEAISVLKKIVFSDTPEKLDNIILQKAHMALIQAYFQDDPRKNDKDIDYLIRLFKNRYKDSTLLYAVYDWNTHRISSR